jgi:hypothetical protein
MNGTDREISGKDFLADIRAGLDDVSLMRKYEVSRRQLMGVLKKLVDVGILDVLEKTALEIHSPTFVLDVRSGMTDDQLMMKYRLSEPELEAVWDRLIAQGSLTKVDSDRRRSVRLPAPSGQSTEEPDHLEATCPVVGHLSQRENGRQP